VPEVKVDSSKIYTIPDFLNSEDCEKLIDYHKRNVTFKNSDQRQYYNDRVLAYPYIPSDHPVKAILRDCRTRTFEKLEELYGEKEIYCGYTHLVRWPDGMALNMHRDFSYQVYTAVLYLNDGYEGGELLFYRPKKPMKIAPEKGMLVIFPNPNHTLHGVAEIKGGDRYTMPMWFTYDESKGEGEISFPPIRDAEIRKSCID